MVVLFNFKAVVFSVNKDSYAEKLAIVVLIDKVSMGFKTDFSI